MYDDDDDDDTDADNEPSPVSPMLGTSMMKRKMRPETLASVVRTMLVVPSPVG